MAVYKVIQDIEAEDKLLGPLTFKGLIYAGIALVCAYINFRLLLMGGLGPIKWVLLLIFFLPMLLFGVLASPLGRDQPTEVWLLSHVRFLLKPRIRLWNQSGIQHLVTITAPKKLERQLTKNLSQTEVRSRLQTLATTLDSRGWAVKNVNVNLGAVPSYLQNANGDSDRLIDASSLSQDTQPIDVHASDDILDEQNNPTAQKFAELMQKADSLRKSEILSRLKGHGQDQKTVDFSIIDQQPVPIDRSGNTKFVASKIVAPGTAADDSSKTTMDEQDKQLLEELRQKEEAIKARHPHLGPKPVATKPENQTQPATMTTTGQADKLELAQSGNAFSVSTLQNLANRQTKIKQLGSNEVEIDFH